MKRLFWDRFAALSCGCCLIVAAGSASAAEGLAAPANVNTVQSAAALPASALRDVKLTAGGRVDGVLTDRQGAPRTAVTVVLVQNEQEVVRTVTDQAGRFAVTGLRGGEYSLVAGDEMTRCRFWTEGAAPPNAKEILQVYEGDLVRGQHFRARNVLTSPAVIGAAIGTAVAVPLALHNREPAS